MTKPTIPISSYCSFTRPLYHTEKCHNLSFIFCPSNICIYIYVQFYLLSICEMALTSSSDHFCDVMPTNLKYTVCYNSRWNKTSPTPKFAWTSHKADQSGPKFQENLGSLGAVGDWPVEIFLTLILLFSQMICSMILRPPNATKPSWAMFELAKLTLVMSQFLPCVTR